MSGNFTGSYFQNLRNRIGLFASFVNHSIILKVFILISPNNFFLFCEAIYTNKTLLHLSLTLGTKDHSEWKAEAWLSQDQLTC